MSTAAGTRRPTGFRAAWQSLVERWIRRRAPVHPPLQLVYRQIFILPTPFGWMLGLLMGAMLIGSLNFNNNLGLLTTFIVAGLAVNSMLVAFRNLHGLTIGDGMASPVFAGQDLSYQVTLASPDARPRPSLRVRGSGNPVAARIAGTGTTRVAIPMATDRRGWHKVGRMQIETTHPLGLFRAWSWFWPRQPYLVWPTPAKRPPPLPEHSAGDGGSSQRQRPDGEEFHSLRNWREGDPVHRIAWKASQRHRDLLSREFRQEQSPELVFDLSAVAARDLEQAISILAAWVLMAAEQGRSWTLRLSGTELGPDRGPAHRDRCLRALAEFRT